MNGRSSKNCLETGCGTGLGILHSLNFKNNESYYTATDISENMIKLS